MSVLVSMMFLSRVVRIAWGKNAGSAVYMEHEGRRFLVTAAHLVKGAAIGDRVLVRHTEEWKPIQVAAITFAADDIDLCVVVPATHWGEGLPTDLLSGEIIVGEEVAFCGFPLGLEMQGMPDARGWPTAFVKSGVFSGAIKVSGQTRYLFDAVNNVGFSGGPILRKLAGGNDVLTIVGIVTGYKYDAPQPVMQKAEDGSLQETPSHFVLPNSGFMYGAPAFQVRKLVIDLLAGVPPSA